MKRRQFITLLAGAGAAAASPLAGRAQQPGKRLRRIGLLLAGAEADPEYQANIADFDRELKRAGWIEGATIIYIYRWATAEREKIERGARDIVSLGPDLIVSSSTATTAALLKLTKTIPIVFTVVVDPVGSGFVETMARPGGNATGFTNLDPRMAGKWLELLREIAPHVTRAVISFNPTIETYSELYLNAFTASGSALGIEVVGKPVRDFNELEVLIAATAREPNSGLIPMPGPFALNYRSEIVTLAARYRIPTIFYLRPFAESGGVLAYGNDNRENWRRAAGYVDRILKGEKPADLPVQFPTRFELVINLKAAKALGYVISPSLLARADQVIE